MVNVLGSLYYLRDGPALSRTESPSLSLAGHLRAKNVNKYSYFSIIT